MPRAAYTIEVELTANAWTDLTGDWAVTTPVMIDRGITPGEYVAGIGQISLALHNPDGRYTPGHAHAMTGFAPGIGLRMRAEGGGEAVTLFVGQITAIDPLPHAADRQDLVHITGQDAMAALTRTRLETFPLMLNTTPKAVVNALVDRCLIPPAAKPFWLLGLPVTGLLGEGTRLAGDDTGKDFDAGQSVFPWVGDTWQDAPRVVTALRDVCVSEGGMFFIAADGTPTFRDRHARPLHLAPDAVLEARLAALRAVARYERIVNRVAITTHPRAVSDQVERVWENTGDIRLEFGIPREIICRYRDPEQQAALLGAMDVVAPAAGTTLLAERRLRYKGLLFTFDASTDVLVEAEIGAASIRLTLTSRYPLDRVVYVTRLEVWGVPLRIYQPVTTIAANEDSRLAHGSLPLILDLPLQDDAAVAGDMAAGLLALRKDPHPWLDVTVEATASEGRLAHGLAREVGDRLSITDPALGLDEAGCFIDRVQHEITRGGASHRVTWLTSPADLEPAWILGEPGHGALDESARLGY